MLVLAVRAPVHLIALIVFAGAEPACAAGFSYADGPAPDELVLSGAFADLAPGEKRTLTRATLRALPGVVTRRERPIPGMDVADLEVLPITALLRAHPLAANADMLVVRANDRWKSYWSRDFIAAREPWLLVAKDGKTPAEGWSVIKEFQEPLAPYLGSASAPADGAAWDGYTPAHGMASSSQVVELIAVNEADHFKPYHAGPLEKPAPPVGAGRALFMRNCMNCHQGPGGLGGNLSRRPFMILQTHAAYNADYLRQFVANPKKFMPETIMPAHPQFTPADYAALIAFLKSVPIEPPPAP